jgi:hypothetical protein
MPRPLARLLTIPALLLLGSVPALARQGAGGDAKAKPAAPAASGDNRGTAIDDDRIERIQGVILKLEPTRGGTEAAEKSGDAQSTDRSGPGHVLIHVNTSVVWRDFVRDQVVNPAQTGGVTQLPQGTNSVATKGQPATTNTVFRVAATPRTPIEGRYRSSTDEQSRGGTTPKAAAAAEPGQEPTKDAEKSARPEAKGANKLALQDLKPGLWVEVDAVADQENTNQGEARRITVLKPVGGPDTPAADSAPVEPAKDAAKAKSQPER